MSTLVQQPMDRVLGEINQISAIVIRSVNDDNAARIFGIEIAPLLRSSGGTAMPREAVLKLALLCDCLRVVDIAVSADGTTSAEEIDYVEPLVSMAANFYSRLRREYEPFARFEQGVEEFLDFFRSDDQLFGSACAGTEWLGLGITCRLIHETGDTEAHDAYVHMVRRLMNEIIAVNGLGEASGAEERTRAKLAELLAMGKQMAAAASAATASPGEDPRPGGFTNPQAPDVFSAIAYASQVWRPDPFDVELVHADARRAFERVLERMSDRLARPSSGLAGTAGDEHGRILLIKGESGSGKTHLMRVFRNHVHERGLGFAAYMQMSTRTGSYPGYVLANLIDSLEQPYCIEHSEASGLTVLSDELVRVPGIARDVELLGDEDSPAGVADTGGVHDRIAMIADRILASPGYGGLDTDMLRALLYLQRNEPAVRARVLKYLRGIELGAYDRRLLGDMPPLAPGDDTPLRMIRDLGRLMWTTRQGVLVVLIDQLEDILELDNVQGSFSALMKAIRSITDTLPSAVVVLSCVDDLYTRVKEQHLTQSLVDRIERDPEPVRLSSRRTADEIEAMVDKRLGVLFDTLDIRRRDDDPLFPFTRAQLHALAHMRTRDVLDWCRQHQESCIAAGALVEVPVVPTGGSSDKQGPEPRIDPSTPIEQEWTEFRAEYREDPPDDDAERMEILAWALDACASELEDGYAVRTEVDGAFCTVTAPGPAGAPETLYIGICNQGDKGGWFMRQILALGESAGTRRPVVVRCSPYPTKPTSKSAQAVGELVQRGGRRACFEDGTWRAMLALRAFCRRPGPDDAPAGLAAWRRRTQPLTQLQPLRDVLGLSDERIPVTPPAAAAAATDAARAAADADAARAAAGADAARAAAGADAAKAAAGANPRPPGPPVAAAPRSATEPPVGALHLGTTVELYARPLAMRPARLTYHAAFLGATGSGKTTLALSVIEQLLSRGIPVVLVDRKGDLAGYAQAGWWRDIAEPERRAQAESLARQIDVHLYTPGEISGRPLAIQIVPGGMAELPDHERSQLARYAASGLGAMMLYNDNGSNRAKLSILSKAIELLAQLRSADQISIRQIIELVHAEDATLVNAIGRLDTKHFRKLVDDLETLAIGYGQLLSQSGALLDPAELLGDAARVPGKTRLSIISTKFLGEKTSIEFWISRLLIEVRRWASKHPSEALQAVLLFDEADLYLPATSKPATKEPMQDLLKRARSAGLGILLATQNPGDLDYRSRDQVGTWFMGKVSDGYAVSKMRSLLSDCPGDVGKKLATQGVGEFFMLAEGKVVQLKGERSLLTTRQLGDDAIRALAGAIEPAGKPAGASGPDRPGKS